MKKIYILISLVFLMLSCEEKNENEEISDVELKFTQFDVALSKGEKVIGIIDEAKKYIVLEGIKDPLEITSVTYEYSEGVSSITPDPETRIDKWERTEKFILNSNENFQEYTIHIKDPALINQATISPLETFGTYIKYHMLDLNANPLQVATTTNANIAFNDRKLNGIRFPLYCGDAFGGHPEEGVVLEEVYNDPLLSLSNAKAAYSGSEPFMIFLGIKVLTSNRDELFPDWVTTDQDDVANPEKYAQLLIDFIKFMNEKGHVIDAVALDKESVRMSIDGFKIAVDTLRARTARLGLTVPKIVAPELLDPQGDVPSGYMNTLYNKGFQDRYDIFGNHYYQRDHTVAGFAKLKYEFDLSQNDKPRKAWATEPHWNGDPDVWVSETAIGVMFDHTDLGLDAFMWWNYPIAGNNWQPKQHIMKEYSDAIHRSIPIRMLDHDGEDTFTKGKLHSRAYLRDDEVNVFLINVVNPNIADIEPISYEDYAIKILDDFKIDGNVIIRQWRDDIANEGETTIIDPAIDNQFLVDLPTGSFTQLTFEITKTLSSKLIIK